MAPSASSRATVPGGQVEVEYWTKHSNVGTKPVHMVQLTLGWFLR